MTRPLDIAAVAAFSEEVRISVPAILAALDAAERDPSDAAAREAYRLIHALKGAASMVGLAAMGHLLNAYEELLDNELSTGVPLTRELLALVREGAPRFATYIDTALAGGDIEPIAHELSAACRAFTGDTSDENVRALMDLLEIERHGLAARPRAFADNAPRADTSPQGPLDTEPPGESAGSPQEAALRGASEAAPAESAGPQREAASRELEEDLLPSEPIPAELAEVFALEAQEHLQTIARLTSHLSTATDDRESLQELRRSVHTIKGAAGVVGYKAASRIAHRMEDLLDRLYEGTADITADVLRLLATSSDTLDDVIQGAVDPDTIRRAVARLFSEYDRLEAEAASAPAAPDAPEVPDTPAAQAAAAPVSEAPAAAPDAPTPAAPAVRAPAEPPAPERRRGADRRRNLQDRRTAAQVVRVPFERLSELVRLVSELVINRSSFDQHFAGLVEQVDEIRLSTARLRRVSQKLETDYEVRALASNLRKGFEAGSEGGHGFDELEFDRYTDFHLLSRELTETATDIGTISTRLTETISNFDGDLTRLGRLTREVQDKVMEFRMVPLVSLAARLERTVRVTAEECGKKVELVLEGENVALDKTLLEEMTDPLLHLLRNAVDHGIEPPGIRVAAGKPERGRIAVRAFHEGTDVLIEVEDDGSGLDAERIRREAIGRGLVSEAEAAGLTLDDLSAFVFEPGFSTATRVSEVSGRGVGLDIVKAKVGRVGGRIRIASRPSAGTTVSVRVPMTLAITRILLVRAGGETLGLPLGAVVQIVRPDAAAIATVGTERVVTVDDRTYPLRDLADALGLPRPAEGAERQPVLVANLGGRRVALAVDEIVQSRDAVVKNLGSHLRKVPGVWGATLLGDGTVILILNPADLAGAAEEPRARGAAARGATAVSPSRDVYSVLIVDDSISMRHVLSSAVKKAGWNPLQARDGVEALELVHRASTPPDVILLDIEMPRMDGYEFLATVRAQEAYAWLPIVMLTSRGGDKHREKAMSLGANGYIVKPFQEEALLQTLSRLVRESREGQRRAAS